ncbi:MAG: HNH endonuclease [Desulfamplus sp.]|nr:HNH endonuclease [Desulfamplus sp.]
MKTYLFAWNPKKWNWTTLEQSIEQLHTTGTVKEKWSVISHKKIKVGDRAFLMRLGEEPKGIMAAGIVTSLPFLSQHWSGEDKLVNRVYIEFDTIISPQQDKLLNLESLNKGVLSNYNWTPQSSGVEIPDEIAEELESIWFDFINTNNHFIKSSYVDNEISYSEGNPNQVLVTRYERNPYARKVCIEHYGLSCVVCEFNFEEVYGKIGKDFIHVHHLKQISIVGEEYNVDPIKDLRPVCPNCHSMIHKRKEQYSIEEIKKSLTNTST